MSAPPEERLNKVILEHQLQPELYLAGRSRAQDLSRTSRLDVVDGIRKGRRIGKIEELRAELYVEIVPPAEVPHDHKVQVAQTRTVEDVSPAVAVIECCWELEG